MDANRGGKDLGLSLRLQTDHHQEREEGYKEEIDKKENVNDASLPNHNKLQRTDHHLAGISSHAAAASLHNRKARVSVRARCQTATVSQIYHMILALLINIFHFNYTLLEIP